MRRKQTGSTAILLVGGVAVLLVLGFAVVLLEHNSAATTTQPQQTAIPTFAPTQSAFSAATPSDTISYPTALPQSAIETTSTKPYRASQFSFAYPSSWQEQAQQTTQGVTTVTVQPVGGNASQTPSVVVQVSPSNLSPANLGDYYIKGGYTATAIKIDGLPATQYRLNPSTSTMQTIGEIVDICNTGKFIYLIRIDYPPTEMLATAEEVFARVVSSLKLTPAGT